MFSGPKITSFGKCVTLNWSHPYRDLEIGAIDGDLDPEKSVLCEVCHPRVISGMSAGVKIPIQGPLKCQDPRNGQLKGPWMGDLSPPGMPGWPFLAFLRKCVKNQRVLGRKWSKRVRKVRKILKKSLIR